MPNEFTGLLGTLGLPDLTLRELSQQRRRQAREQELASVDQRYAGADQATQIGARIGSVLGGVGRDTVSDSETKRVLAVQTAQQRFKEAVERNPALGNIEGEAKQNVFQKILADELARNGEITAGLDVGAQLTQKRKAQQARDLELEKIGISRDQGLKQLRATDISNDRQSSALLSDRTGQVTSFFDKATGEETIGWIQPDGTAITRNEDGSTNTLNIGEYQLTDPNKGKAGGRLTAADFKIGTKEASALRALGSNFMEMTDLTIDMRRTMEEAIAEGGSVDTLGPAGTVSSFATKGIDTIAALARTAAKATGITTKIGEDNITGLDSEAKANKYVDDRIEMLDQLAKEEGAWEAMPEALRSDARRRARFYAASVRYSYSLAQANEPSARQFSENDFNRAAIQGATDLTDPQAWAEVTIENVNRAYKRLHNQWASVGDEALATIVPRQFMNDVAASKTRFDEVFANPLETAANPNLDATGTLEQPTSISGTPQNQSRQRGVESGTDIGDGFSFRPLN